MEAWSYAKTKQCLTKENEANNRASLRSNIYRGYKEWPYKNVKPRIIAEKYMEDESGELRIINFIVSMASHRLLWLQMIEVREMSRSTILTCNSTIFLINKVL